MKTNRKCCNVVKVQKKLKKITMQPYFLQVWSSRYGKHMYLLQWKIYFILASLFKILSTQTNIAEYAIEQITLESIFLKVIKENNVKEEDRLRRRGAHWWKCC